MEGVCSRNQNALTPLLQGRELVNQLKIQLPLSNSSEKYNFFVEKIKSSLDNAIALLNPMVPLENGTLSHVSGNTSESPNLLENSSKSEGSDPDYKDQTLKAVSKKRKIAQKLEVVRLRCGTGLESNLNDGYSWRKYGQKVILNTSNPRAYYRCTYLNTRRCLAKKHVQRTDDDPLIFEVVYKGEHSCVQETIKQKKENFGAGINEEEGGKHVQQMAFGNNTEAGLKVEPREPDVTDDATANFPSFSFPSTPVESQGSEDVAPLFLDLSKDSNFIRSYSTPFISPATSESYFSLSQAQANGFVIGNSLSSESDFAEIVSNATTSTFGDLDSWFDRVDFDPKFIEAFDNFC